MQIEGSFRRQLGTACTRCKRRKIRCDRLDQNQRCSQCTKGNWRCEDACTPPKRPSLQTGPAAVSANTPSEHDRADVPKRRRQNIGQAPEPYHDQMPSDQLSGRSPMPSDEPRRDRAIVLADESGNRFKSDTWTRFYHRGIKSSKTAEFSSADTARLVYIGNRVSNLYHMVQSINPNDATHCPFPPIKPIASWQPSLESAALSHTYLSTTICADMATLPARELRDELIDTYFNELHPSLMIINEREFRERYADPSHPPPLLLLQCILLSAARISQNASISSDRSTLTAAIYRRAKSLFEMRHENDRMFLVVAALHLCWHVEDHDTVSNGPYHWSGLATRIAMGLGMHRNLAVNPSSIVSIADKIMYKRIFWAVLRTEANVALELGRPASLRETDYDQEQITQSDILYDTDEVLGDFRLSYLLADVALSRLSLKLISHVSFLVNIDETQSTIADELAHLSGLVTTACDHWSCETRIKYSLLTLMLYRSHSKSNIDASQHCTSAATNILNTLETMVRQGNIHQCSYFASTAILAVAIQLHRSMTITPNIGLNRTCLIIAQDQLQRLHLVAEILSQTWPHIGAIAKLILVFVDGGLKLLNGTTQNAESSAVQCPFTGLSMDAQLYEPYPFDLDGLNSTWLDELLESRGA